MESHQDPSLFLSLQQLIEELENFIILESGRNGNPWISVTKLTEFFYEKHGVSLEEVAKAQGYSDSLRSLFTSSRRFSIYSTQIPQEFYVALLQVVVPDFQKSQPTLIKYRIKRSWRIAENLLRMLKVEGVEEIPLPSTQRVLEHRPILISEIKSVNDLENALIEIIKSLTANHPKKFVTIGVLSQNFFDYYQRPIRTVIRSVCPDMKLIELLQTIPSLHIQKLDNDWRIAVETHSSD